MARLASPGRRFDHLAPHPGRGRVRGDVHVHQFPPAVSDEHQHVERLERECLHSQQIGGPQVVTGSKGGALRHYCRTSPPSALRAGQATRRCTQLASNVLSPSWLLPVALRPVHGAAVSLVGRHAHDYSGHSALVALAHRPSRSSWSMRAIGQEENNQVPGSHEGTLTSEGRPPSAFPRTRA